MKLPNSVNSYWDWSMSPHEFMDEYIKLPKEDRVPNPDNCWSPYYTFKSILDNDDLFVMFIQDIYPEYLI